MVDLREKNQQNNEISKCWAESIKHIKNDIGERFELLSLKDKKVKYSKSETHNDILVLQDLVKQECADFSVHKTTKVSLKSMPFFFDRVYKNGSAQYTYLSIIKGHGASRTKSWIKKYFEKPIPHPWLLNINDDHFVSLKKSRELQSLGVVMDERYKPSSISKSATGSDSGLIIDNELKEKFGEAIFVQKNLATWSRCRSCNKPRCFFILNRDQREKRRIIRETEAYLQILPLQCGMPLFAVSDEFQLSKQIFLKQSVTCGATMENIYYHGTKPPMSFPVVCVYCGSSDEISKTNTILRDGRKTRPQCEGCCSDINKKRIGYGKKNIMAASTMRT